VFYMGRVDSTVGRTSRITTHVLPIDSVW